MDDFLYSNAIRKPTQINIYPGITSVSASWDPNPMATHYNVKIIGPNVDISDTVDKNRLYISGGLAPNTNYTFYLTAFKDIIQSQTLTNNFTTLPEPVFQIADQPQKIAPQEEIITLPEEEINPCICMSDPDCFNCAQKPFCVDGTCKECVGDKCSGGRLCIDGECTFCRDDVQCGEGYKCSDNICIIKPTNYLLIFLPIVIILIFIFILIFTFSQKRINPNTMNIL